MSEIRYVCEGKCRRMITIESYKQGKKTCSTDNCDMYGKELTLKEYCPRCNNTFDEGEDHICL
ncbi:MAG: hypothetical protein ABH824_00715 [Nanoarchaeota archaeon]|nr:hypothetical protein [Nanoarchaeota archaeon]MBU1631665.1 hypothetical protein [Nanoarchaeota archaeon]MBU1875635.1 hypothetical protein [Nanoarchaeota archaeon]